MNHLETGVSGATTTADAAIAKPASPASNDGLVWNGSSWTNAKLVNANIDPAAAIVYSKLSLAGGIVNNDVSGSAAIALSKIAIGGTVSQVVKGDGSVALPGLYRKTTSKTVNTTISATDLLNAEITIAAGVLGTTGMLRLAAWGDWLNNSGGAVTPPRFQLVFGGTTVFDSGTYGTATSVSGATRKKWVIRASFINLGAANSQEADLDGVLFYDVSSGGGSSFTTGFGTALAINGVPTSISPIFLKAVNESAIDTSLAKALVLNVINGSASASYETKLTGAIVEVL